MEIISKQRSTTKRSDWCKALSVYSHQQKICGNCLALKESLPNYILPIHKAPEKLKGVDLQLFCERLQNKNKPVILKNEHLDQPSTFLIYLSTELHLDPVVASLSLSKNGKLPAATVISPAQLPKHLRTKETSLVRELQLFFDPTSFIKLPMDDIEELISYAAAERCELILLPFGKMKEYLQLIIDHPKAEIIPALFYPETVTKPSFKADE